MKCLMETLRDEIKDYLKHQPGLERVTRALVADWVVGTRGIECERGDFEEAFKEVEKELGVTFPKGGPYCSMVSMNREEMIETLKQKNEPDPSLVDLPSPSRLVH